MRYMVVERFKPGGAGEIYRRARDHGRMLPAGLKYIDSWVGAGLDVCFQLMECEDESQFDEWIANWDDLGSFEIIAVISSAEASKKALR